MTATSGSGGSRASAQSGSRGSSGSGSDRAGSRAESALVYVAGLVQGIALVTFPAAHGVLTSKSGYGLSSGLYGAMFIPQVVLAIVSSIVGGGLARRFGPQRILVAGLVADLVSMAALLGSAPLQHDTGAAYPLLLVATAAQGAGFGLAVPMMNTLSAALHPKSVDRSGLVLNALLGLGTALAPVFVAVFTGLGFWWGLPIFSGVLIVVLIVGAARLRPPRSTPDSGTASRGISRALVLFAIAALLYGIVETLSGNWAQTAMTDAAKADSATASLALTAFWAVVTGGRVLFALLQKRIGSLWIYRVLPLVVVVAFALVVLLRPGGAVFGILIFALAGLGCSALWPLTLSLGEERVPATRFGVTGPIVAVYQAGYGVAAFGGGQLFDAGLPPAAVFGMGAVVAGGLFVTALVIGATGRKRGASSA